MTYIFKFVKQLTNINYNQAEPFITNLHNFYSSLSTLNFTSNYLNQIRNQEALEKIYRPTIYLKHPFLQSVYNVAQPLIKLNYMREKIFFQDGGHVCLDWAPSLEKVGQKYLQVELQPQAPIFLVMHGLTGGSQMNYVKARRKKFRSVCFNSRGICSQMTSPIPFSGVDFDQFQQSLNRIQQKYPNAPIYLVGASYGSNFLTRYLIRNKRKNIKGFVGLATPFNISKVMTDMGSVYQKFFVKRYIEDTYLKHPQMKFWEEIGLINLKQIENSKNLFQFHERTTIKILKFKDVNTFYDVLNIGNQIQNLDVPSLFINSRDDPIVSVSGIPIDSIRKNKNIEYLQTPEGGHVCWYEGNVPKRWYPKPTLQFIQKLIEKQKNNPQNFDQANQN